MIPSDAPPSPERAPRALGTFLAADIVGHRHLPEAFATEAVRFLRAMAAEATDEGCACAQVADRVLICQAGLAAGDFVGRARRLVADLATLGGAGALAHGCGARIALHCGLFQTVEGIPFGPGPSDCTQLTAFATESVVVCSSPFAGVWAEQAGQEIYDAELWPKIAEVSAEHRRRIWRPEGFQVGVRDLPDLCIFLLAGRPGTAPLHVPARIVEMDQVEQRLFQLCDAIGLTALDLIGESSDAPGSWKRVRARLFVRVDEAPPRKPRLVATKFESGLKKTERFASVAGTQYEQIGRGHFEGPVGRALVTGQTQVTAPLPDPTDNPDGYVAALAGPPWRIEEEKVRRFRRKARRFVAVPLPNPFGPAELVLCVDFGKDPHVNVSEEELLDVGNVIQATYGPEIAALFRLRTG